MCTFSAKVVKIIDNETIVINKGERDGIATDHKFLVYNIGEMIFDPETKEELGYLEIVCGEAKIKHLQEKLATLYSNRVRHNQEKTIRTVGNIFSSFAGDTEEIYNPTEEVLPFENVKIGSLVRIL